MGLDTLLEKQANASKLSEGKCKLVGQSTQQLYSGGLMTSLTELAWKTRNSVVKST